MNLGLNCHIQPKYEKLHKQVEIEALYHSLKQLENNKTIAIKTELTDQLLGESTKHRNPKHKSILTPSLRKAARGLKNNSDIVIRKADKSSVYVILDKEDYLAKLNSLLNDKTKFKKIKKDPTNTLKQSVNQLIDALNAAIGDIKINKIIGDYQPGYIYGNVKTHKTNNPLRPIISQIPSPTYNLAKTLNKIISPYIPNEFSLKSTNDFIDLLHVSECSGIIASLDVESLFTNVPIDDTIDIILQHAYNHQSLPPPKIPPLILRQLLELCTKESPFKCPEGQLYLQTDGVAMGSPLGSTFANFYMGDLEKRMLKDFPDRPSLYARYVDDIFVQVKDERQLKSLINLFQNNSVLKFTYELNVNNKLPFLDVLVDTNNDKFYTTLYRKPTDNGNCLNAKSECVEKYKSSVITNYLNRAFKVSQTWQDFHTETLRIKQILINNNYSNKTVDAHIKKFVSTKVSPQTNGRKHILVPIFYHNQTHSNYKIDERVLSNIIRNNTKCLDNNNKLKLIFYYRNKKTQNLVMKNNMASVPSELHQTNVVYKFHCPFPHSKAEEYIGLTQTTLSRRLTMHGQSGSIYKHFIDVHNQKPTRKYLTENTTIIAKANDRYKLAIKEALLILQNIPSLNVQSGNFSNVLKLHNNYNSLTLNTTKDDPPITSVGKIQQQEPTETIHVAPPNPTLDRKNVSNLNCFNFESDTEILQDFEQILSKFGITHSKLKYVTLENYRWWEFETPRQVTLTPTSCNEQQFTQDLSFDNCLLTSNQNNLQSMPDTDSPTISQRIKSLSRRARRTHVTMSTSL